MHPTDQDIYQPTHAIRVITATALFDGHDAAINIMRRMLQSSGAEVIHLGHNRSVQEIVEAAIQEDVQGVAVSSYQGGHMEFFRFLVQRLKERRADHIRIFGGGGGVIVPTEIKALEAAGVTRIFSPEDGRQTGLQGIVNHMLASMDFDPLAMGGLDADNLRADNPDQVAKFISAVIREKKSDHGSPVAIEALPAGRATDSRVPVVGITGTGGAGKSSLTDELIVRLLYDNPHLHVAVICCDPSRRKTGGALLGDRIRMNAIGDERVFMRSLATRRSGTELPAALPRVLQVAAAAGYDLIIAETAGIGQGDASIVDLADISVYVMTSEFGAASQLEKIDMLDFADLVAVNKYEKQGAEDAVRAVGRQMQQNRQAWDRSPADMPVFGTIAAHFNDDGVTALYHALRETLERKCGLALANRLPPVAAKTSSSRTVIIPSERNRYLSEIAATVRDYHGHSRRQTEALREVWHLTTAADTIAASSGTPSSDELIERLGHEIARARAAVTADTSAAMQHWTEIKAAYADDRLTYTIRGQEIQVPLFTQSLARQRIPKIALPGFEDPGEIYRWLREENLPGHFPFTAGVYPLKRQDEEPTRMFAGEGDPDRTNRRFKLLSEGYGAQRLSTAFDSVTLYGCDPDRRPDIYGKVGTSGVNVCTLEDVRALYAGFDLSAPNTSVSMTINGPAPIMLAMFLNAAIDQQLERFGAQNGKMPSTREAREIQARVLKAVRGTVQADILKEDQGQNTCIFSIDFALKMMGDIQAYFIAREVRNFYSVSISGYHIAEAGANPITQLALTLSNGFTYVEYYLSRGMEIDSFAPNLSFFFSNGMDPEYTVIGRVARRIWAIAMHQRYSAAERSQKLKYHIQTSGRSLHSQDIQLNDIRTTLQALCAVYDNCNSLHTNAFDEAITTPSAESVRRALAIQLVINREWGLAKNENTIQGSFIVEELTRLVEEAVLMEFDRLTARGGVLGAMETGYQRGKIQEESLHYEALKHSGQHPIIGVNTFQDPDAHLDELSEDVELSRATEAEKSSQLSRLAAFHQRHAEQAPAALEKLQQAALSGDNIFAELMHTVRFCSLGQITRALYRVGGRYRRSM